MLLSQKLNREIEILLIEDNPSDVRLTSLALKGFSFPLQLRVAADGAEALEFLKKRGQYVDANRPDVILLDWNLPRMDGGEVLREIRQAAELKDIPVVVITSSDWNKTISEAFDSGANLYLTKPMNLDRFSFLMDYVLETLKNKIFPTQE